MNGKYTEKERADRARASREWKRRNREHVAKKLREWLVCNKERRDIWTREYLDKTKARRKAWYATYNIEKRSDPGRKERKKTYMKKWVSQNRHIVNANVAKRKAIKLGARTGNQLVISTWIKSWRSSRSVKCYWCERYFIGKTGHTDHIVPLTKGGAHSIENLCASCADCNRHKYDKSPDDWNAVLASPVLL